ncbi:MAG: vWA domain-containing protein [Litorimonas sp.]
MISRFVSNMGQSFRQNERGNVAIMTAVALMVIVGATALSLDVSKGVNTKSRLADATDALSIVLAKTRVHNQAEMRAIAQDFLDNNYPASSGNQIEILSLSWDGDAVTVKLSDVSKNTFGSFLGREKLDVSVASTAVFSRKKMDIALVLDSTGSMSGSKMSNLKSAATEMVDIIDEYSDTNVRMSVVPFSDYVNVGVSERNASWSNVLPDRTYQPARSGQPAVAELKWLGCVGSRNVPDNLRVAYNGRKIPALYKGQVNCGTELLPLTTNFNAVKSTINGLVASGWTYMPSGIVWGWRTLDDNAPFSHFSANETEKVMILMTDGQNTRAKNGIMHNQAGQNNKADQTTRDLCGAVKDQKIIIYTIAYEVNDASTRDLLKGCATLEKNYFNAQNAGQLRKAFEEIANTLVNIRISS